MPFSSQRPAIFLDRDGTLIEDRGYLRCLSDVVFYPEAFSALRRIKDRYLLFIVTNQSGIGLGVLSPEDVELINNHIVKTLAQEGVTITKVYTCPHTRDQGCQCIKPNPYFILEAAREFNLDLSRSFSIGDHSHDVEFGRNVGAKGIFLLTGHGQKHRHELPSRIEVAGNIEEAIIRILKEDMDSQEKEGMIRQAAKTIQKGGVVAFPTETVYGLGANAFNPLAVARIFEVKKRPHFDPLIVHVVRQHDLKKLVTETPSKAIKLMERFWPGPLTLVLSKKEEVPDIVTSGLPTVAVRMPKHPIAQSLIEQSGCPIAAPSANLFGQLSPTTAGHVHEQLRDQIDLILDGGPCEVGVESTIVSFAGETPALLRPGGVTLEEIESVIGAVEVGSHQEKISAPGMLPRHYAPRTPIMINWSEESLKVYKNKKIGFLAFQSPMDALKCSHVEILSKKGDLREAAANLFSAIRRLDALDLDLILAESVPETGLGRAIMDRLRRASGIIPTTQDSIHTFRGKGKGRYTSEDLLNDRRLEGREEDGQKK